MITNSLNHAKNIEYTHLTFPSLYNETKREYKLVPLNQELESRKCTYITKKKNTSACYATKKQHRHYNNTHQQTILGI